MDHDLTRQTLAPIPDYNRQEEPPRADPLDFILEDDYSRRPPHWRWLLIQRYATENTRPSRADDTLTHRGTAYLTQYLKFASLIQARTDIRFSAAVIRQARKDLSRKFPEIAQAHGIFRAAGDERWMLEAFLCTGASSEVLAKDMSATPRLVDTYEALFFDVRSRLRCESFVSAFILHPRQLQGTYGADADLLWKDLAFWHGREIFKMIIGGRTFAQEEVESYMKAIQSNSMRSAIMAQRSRAITPHTSETIMEEVGALQQHQLAAGNAGQIGGKMAQGAELLVGAMKYTRAGISGGPVSSIETRPVEALRKRLEERGFNAKKLPERVE